MITIEQCYLFRRGFTKEMAKIKLTQRDLKEADVISFHMKGRTPVSKRASIKPGTRNIPEHRGT